MEVAEDEGAEGAEGKKSRPAASASKDKAPSKQAAKKAAKLADHQLPKGTNVKEGSRRDKKRRYA